MTRRRGDDEGDTGGDWRSALPRKPPRALTADTVSEDQDGALIVFSFAAPVDDASPLSRLTDAEREVAALACAGLSNADIADRRGTAVRTVAKQLERIYRRLSVGSRSELAVVWARAGAHRHRQKR